MTDRELEIQNLFHPSRSYVYNGNIVDKFLLRHELYHFHITELFARKCMQELSQFEQVPSRDRILDVLAANRSLEEHMQHAYDDESYHGYVLKEQKLWELKVDSLLT